MSHLSQGQLSQGQLRRQLQMYWCAGKEYDVPEQPEQDEHPQWQDMGPAYSSDEAGDSPHSSDEYIQKIMLFTAKKKIFSFLWLSF